MTSMTPVDALKCAAALLRQRMEWTTDTIGDCDSDHDIELDAINDTSDEITKLAAEFGDPRVYSDGRAVMTRKEIQRGLVTEVVWHPDARRDACRSWSACLPSDPGIPSPGVYIVSTHPARQFIDVRIVRPELESSGS
ncbi:hypothetical protein [Mycobacterium avium]|uniref:hypothetical protein n=1 Tax=Mycobacterium avium TaxID=1764 RepID=UPI002665626C|nr:hypothetical protein [Mycobacterium avium]MDO2354672.1 hypothetical protein [Mycobacterium avium subsp. hominissuis]